MYFSIRLLTLGRSTTLLLILEAIQKISVSVFLIFRSLQTLQILNNVIFFYNKIQMKANQLQAVNLLQDHENYRPESIIIYAYNQNLSENQDNLYMSKSLILSTFRQNDKGTYHELKKNKKNQQYSLKQILLGRRKITIVGQGLSLGKGINFVLPQQFEKNLRQLNEKSPQEMAEILFENIDKSLWKIKIILDASSLGVRQDNKGSTFISIFSQRLTKKLNQISSSSQLFNLNRIIIEGRGGLVNRENRDYVLPFDFAQLRDKINFKVEDKQLEKVINHLSKYKWSNSNLTDQEALKEARKQADSKTLKLIESTSKHIFSIFRKPFHILDPQILIIKGQETGNFFIDSKSSNLISHTSGSLGRNQNLKKHTKLSEQMVNRFLPQQIKKQQLQEKKLKVIQEENKFIVGQITQNQKAELNQILKRFLTQKANYQQRAKDKQFLMSLNEKEIKMIPYIVEKRLDILVNEKKLQEVEHQMLRKGIISSLDSNTFKSIQDIQKVIRKKVTCQEIVAWYYYKTFKKQQHFTKLSQAEKRLLNQMEPKYKNILFQMLFASQLYRPQSKLGFMINQKQRIILKRIRKLRLIEELNVSDFNIFNHYQQNIREVLSQIISFHEQYNKKLLTSGKRNYYIPYNNYLDLIQKIQYLQNYYRHYQGQQSLPMLQKYQNYLKDVYKEYIKFNIFIANYKQFIQINHIKWRLQEFKKQILRLVHQQDEKWRKADFQQHLYQKSNANPQHQQLYNLVIQYFEQIKSFKILIELNNHLEKNGQYFQVQLLNYYKQKLINFLKKLEEKISALNKVQKYQIYFLDNIRKTIDKIVNYDYSAQSQMSFIRFDQSQLLNRLQIILKLSKEEMKGICFGLTVAFNYDQINNEGFQKCIRRFKTIDQMTRLLENEYQLKKDQTYVSHKFFQDFQSIIKEIRLYQTEQQKLSFEPEFSYRQGVTVPISDVENNILKKMIKDKPYNIGLQLTNEVEKQFRHAISITKKQDDRFIYFDCNNNIKANISRKEVIEQLKISSIWYSESTIFYIQANGLKQQEWINLFDQFQASLQQYIRQHNPQLQFRRVLGGSQQKVKCVKYNLEQLRQQFRPSEQTPFRDKKVLIVQLEGDYSCSFSSKAMVQRYKQNCELVLQYIQGLQLNSYRWNPKTNDVQIKPVCQDLMPSQKLDIKIVGHGQIVVNQNGINIAKLGDKYAIQIVEKIKKIIVGKKASSLRIELIGCKSAHQNMAFQVGKHLESIGKALSINDPNKIELVAYQHNIQVTDLGKVTKEALKNRKQRQIIENQISKIKIRPINGGILQTGISEIQRQQLDLNLDKLVDENLISKEESGDLKSRGRKSSSFEMQKLKGSHT